MQLMRVTPVAHKQDSHMMSPVTQEKKDQQTPPCCCCHRHRLWKSFLFQETRSEGHTSTTGTAPMAVGWRGILPSCVCVTSLFSLSYCLLSSAWLPFVTWNIPTVFKKHDDNYDQPWTVSPDDARGTWCWSNDSLRLTDDAIIIMIGPLLDMWFVSLLIYLRDSNKIKVFRNIFLQVVHSFHSIQIIF